MIRSILFQVVYWLTSLLFAFGAMPLLLLPSRGPMMAWIRAYTRVMRYWMRRIAGVKIVVKGPSFAKHIRMHNRDRNVIF